MKKAQKQDKWKNNYLEFYMYTYSYIPHSIVNKIGDNYKDGNKSMETRNSIEFVYKVVELSRRLK